jgi:hypothetical protein
LGSLAFVLGWAGRPSASSDVTQEASTLPTVAGNHAPTVSGTATEFARVDQDYLYVPDFKDPDGDALTFSAANLPGWAQLDTVTGQISGRPGTSHLGSYESITVTASDGQHEVSTREFAITVVGPSTGVARLEWPAPVSKVDGSMLDDLAGFRILYGRDPEALDHSVWIASPTAQSYEFATLAEGAWYFSVVAVNSGGLEGPATTPTRKII